MRLNPFKRRPKIFTWNDNYTIEIFTAEPATNPAEPIFYMPDNYHGILTCIHFTGIFAAGIRVTSTLGFHLFSGSTLRQFCDLDENLPSSITKHFCLSTHANESATATPGSYRAKILPSDIHLLPHDRIHWISYDPIVGDIYTNIRLTFKAYELY